MLIPEQYCQLTAHLLLPRQGPGQRVRRIVVRSYLVEFPASRSQCAVRAALGASGSWPGKQDCEGKGPCKRLTDITKRGNGNILFFCLEQEQRLYPATAKATAEGDLYFTAHRRNETINRLQNKRKGDLSHFGGPRPCVWRLDVVRCDGMKSRKGQTRHRCVPDECNSRLYTPDRCTIFLGLFYYCRS